jgi:hypothetical protein
VINAKAFPPARVFGTVIAVVLFVMVARVAVPSALKISAESPAAQKKLDHWSDRVTGGNGSAPAPAVLAVDTTKMNACGLPGMPANAAVHVVGVYSGEKEVDVQLGDSGHTTTEEEVVVDETPEPVVLVLSAYDPVVWKVSTTPRARLAGVLVLGHHTQALLGVSKSMPRRVLSTEQSTGCDPFTIKDRSELRRRERDLIGLIGKRADEFHGEAAGGFFQIGGDRYNRPSDAVMSPDLTLDDYPVYRGAIPAGEKGLDALERQGKIRRATAADLAPWQNDAQRASRLRSGLSLGSVYVVLKEITLPPGLFGAHRADFIIPAGVPKPNGPKGHCDFYFVKDGTVE